MIEENGCREVDVMDGEIEAEGEKWRGFSTSLLSLWRLVSYWRGKIDRIAEFSKASTSSSPVENRTVGDSNGKSHNLDYPPLPIISAPLNGNNWLAWRRAVRIALGARNLWLQLEARYGESNGPLLYQLQREINSMTQATCTCGLCICGYNNRNTAQIEASQLMQFLMGLHETFDGVRSQILVVEPLPHVDKAFSIVMRVERKWKVNMETVETGMNNAMYARNGD
ncbi:UNVERIFIED_CONTAM: hypothetical protein Sangu_0994200 [Sesamum angustifolium]|uniref:Retrotransposon Copia-like N-terminal domain-containing protein n=1 Tax=Sesamum angustifolium TaxID=2727405 RepID=A0AAW2PH21_9LAMI